MIINDAIAVSNKYGSDPEYVIAGGGNISCKNEKDLFIKCSGISMANIDKDGFVRMDREKLSAVFRKSYTGNSTKVEEQVLEDIMNARGNEDYQKRPSVEVLLHDIFPQVFVFHVHPSIVNGITCAKEGQSAMIRLFQDKAMWIPMVRPGYALAISAKEIIDKYRSQHGSYPAVVFLENHGVFFASDNVNELENLIKQVMDTISGEILQWPDLSHAEFDREKAAALAPAVRMLTGSGGTSIASFVTNNEVQKLVASKSDFAALMSAFTPDQIAYCLPKPLFIQDCGNMDEQYDQLEKKMNEYYKLHHYFPKIVAAEGLGFYACGKDKKDADTAADMFLDAVKINVYANSFGGAKFLEDGLIEFIDNWEVEKYRRNVSLGEKHSDSITEKIAIVTGGAQGFGKGIAEELASRGVNVVIADLNEKTATETASELAETYGGERIAVTQADVADEKSTKDMIMFTVLEYGGLDIYINNAGINKPGSLDEIDVETFERINSVNYTGYFLGAKYASKIMKIQHRYAPDHYMDIIQVNSKSGISGSNKNFAYAGSKFAGIGLTQSFALELVEFNIKVNAICPGNYFEGPLWSDPDNGMFLQYLKAGKVPGSKTVDDVKRAYESKVPMKRGCRAIDVARAVIYTIEQEYETGQAIPVTGGQQMLK